MTTDIIGHAALNIVVMGDMIQSLIHFAGRDSQIQPFCLLRLQLFIDQAAQDLGQQMAANLCRIGQTRGHHRQPDALLDVCCGDDAFIDHGGDPAARRRARQGFNHLVNTLRQSRNRQGKQGEKEKNLFHATQGERGNRGGRLEGFYASENNNLVLRPNELKNLPSKHYLTLRIL